MQDDELDRLLAQAAAMPPEPSPALMDRVLADALALQPAMPVPARPQAVAGPSLLARLLGSLGGAPGLSTAAAAAVFGIALGYLNPDTMAALAGGLIDSGTEEYFPSVDFLSTEG